jgi:hypothetical protein
MGQMNTEPHDPVSDAVPDCSVRPRAAARKRGGRTISDELYAAQPVLRSRWTRIDPPGQRQNGRGRRIEFDALIQPLDHSGELRAVQADIRQRVIVERGQFLVDPVPVSPIGKRGPHPDEYTDNRHFSTPGTRVVHCTNNP